MHKHTSELYQVALDGFDSNFLKDVLDDPTHELIKEFCIGLSKEPPHKL